MFVQGYATYDIKSSYFTLEISILSQSINNQKILSNNKLQCIKKRDPNTSQNLHLLILLNQSCIMKLITYKMLDLIID